MPEFGEAGIHTSVPTVYLLTRPPGAETRTQPRAWTTDTVIVVILSTPGIAAIRRLEKVKATREKRL